MNIPFYISVLFALTTVLTVWLFFRASKNSMTTLLILLGWVALQGGVALTGFYTVTDTMPPRFALLVLPPTLVIVVLFLSARGRAFLDQLDLKSLTLLHVVRVPVELVLLFLFLHKAVPQLMTFEGRNFDILAGLTAPLIFYFGYIRKKLSKNTILFWNVLCVALLLNIVTHGVLSAPTPFQQFAFEQPNIGLLYFPFVWLPALVVPLVLLSHLAAIRQLVLAGRSDHTITPVAPV